MGDSDPAVRVIGTGLMGPVIAALIRAAEGSWIPAGPFFAWGLEGGDFNQSFRIAARPQTNVLWLASTLRHSR